MIYLICMNSLYLWALKRAGAIMVPLFVLNWIGVTYSIYGVLWWWDVMTHFLGGIFIGFFVLALAARTGCFGGSHWLRDWMLICLAIFVGWELYEIAINILIPVGSFDYVDTLHDIVNDSLGGLVAYHWYKQFGFNSK